MAAVTTWRISIPEYRGARLFRAGFRSSWAQSASDLALRRKMRGRSVESFDPSFLGGKRIDFQVLFALSVLARALLCFTFSQVHTASAQAFHPSTYDEFVSVNPGEPLDRAVSSGEALLLLPGVHLVNNPLVISRDRPLYLHGASRMQTRLIPRNPGLPLFVVKKGTLINLTNLRIEAPARNPMPDVAAVHTTNTAPVEIEIQDCTLSGVGLVFTGPGSIRLQATSLMPGGLVASAIVVDHPEARFLMVGGNISNMKSPSRSPLQSKFHVWLKRGHVRVFGTGVQATNGVADFRIDSASPAGPHVLANIRSEGSNGAARGNIPPRLLYVPPSDSEVDVMLVGNSASWNNLGKGSGALVDYGAAGTVWLIGNNGSSGLGSLVIGDSPKATLVAIGNISYDGATLFTNSSHRKFANVNLYTHHFSAGDSSPPHIRFSPDRGAEARRLPTTPALELPPPLTRPRLNAPLPGMLNVREFGAAGDGITDDTDEIQSALDSFCDGQREKSLYFPAGTYRVKRVLSLNHRRSKCKKHPAGGWIAGAGREVTTIRSEDPGGVFATEGLAFATVQGLTFKTDAGGEGAAFSLENANGIGHATQGVSFYDVRFAGGKYAVGIGLVSETQCSENLFVDAEFKNADYGLAVGSFNALANIVYRGTFYDNQTAMGHPEETLTGGTWAVIGAKIRGTRRQDLGLRNSANGVWYFYGVDSDSSVIVKTLATGAAFPLVFQSSRFSPSIQSSAPLVDFSAAGGPLFLHSEITQGQIRVHGKISSNFAAALESTAPAWGEPVLLGQNRKLSVQTGD